MRGSYWHREVQSQDRFCHAAPGAADYVILGGGLSGLSTAIALRKRAPHASILLLEAKRVGYGASGRNAGLLSPVPAPIWLLGAELCAEHAWAAGHLNTRVFQVAEWIAAELPGAELATAQLHLVSRGRVANAALSEFSLAVTHTGIGHTLASRGPEAQCVTMDASTVQPYRLVLELARRATELGIRITEGAKVERVIGSTSHALVRLENGTTVTAGRVLVCTNAYTKRALGAVRLRAIPVHSFMAASKPITLEHGAPSHRTFTVESNRAQAYYRSHKGRILYGAMDKLLVRPGSGDEVGQALQDKLAGHMRASMPSADVPLEQAWSGMFHATPTGLPVLRVSKGARSIVLNVGYGGTGVGFSLACASLAAALATGAGFLNDDDARFYQALQTPPVPLRSALLSGARILRAITKT